MASLLSSNYLAKSPISELAEMASLFGMDDLEKRYAHYAARMRAFMDARNITGELGAEMIGAHPTTVYDLRRGAQRLDDEWRVKVAAGFGIDHDALFGSSPLPKPKANEIHERKRRGRKPKAANDNLPHFGLAAGSLLGAHSLSSDLPEEVPCPPGLRDALGAYALTTRGESMIPRYFPNERLYINPNQLVKKGDHVVIQTTSDDGQETQTWVKRYDGETRDSYLVSQYNPPAQIEFRKRSVRYIHRVLPINELL